MVTPDTRGASLPEMKNGVGHWDTQRLVETRKNPFSAAGVPERGPRDNSRFVPVTPACTTQIGPHAPRCPGGTGRPLDAPTPVRGAHLAGVWPAARMVHAGSRRLLGARLRGHGAAGPGTPHPSPGNHVKGL
ncbi:hypothetical protein HJG60_009925 [Phyllostomus discolor]|uniref:Uncharacterized protein n=1 Tax=Phyllostomus discolor TaxID=89673 RepID=A0A834EQH6_9CHIR|nr:hypothetical protein HJG60_009925 [Phyllostomus discolor]